MQPAIDIPVNFRQRALFFYNRALEKYYNGEIEDCRIDLNNIVNHQNSIMDQALALEKLDWAFGFSVCSLSLEASVRLNDSNALELIEFYYLNHMKASPSLTEMDFLRIEAVWLFYRAVIIGDVSQIAFRHLMELWKVGQTDNDDDHRTQIRSLNNIGCLLAHTNACNASYNHFERALANPSILASERDIIEHNKSIIDRN